MSAIRNIDEKPEDITGGQASSTTMDGCDEKRDDGCEDDNKRSSPADSVSESSLSTPGPSTLELMSIDSWRFAGSPNDILILPSGFPLSHHTSSSPSESIKVSRLAPRLVESNPPPIQFPRSPPDHSPKKYFPIFPKGVPIPKQAPVELSQVQQNLMDPKRSIDWNNKSEVPIHFNFQYEWTAERWHRYLNESPEPQKPALENPILAPNVVQRQLNEAGWIRFLVVDCYHNRLGAYAGYRRSPIEPNALKKII